ncbi:MAG: hypothetical protein QXF12_07410 [Candidatus Aenigmatarchaeota archaeon]
MIEQQEENQFYIQYHNSFHAIKVYENHFMNCDIKVESDIYIDDEYWSLNGIDSDIDLILLKLQLFFDLCLNNSIIFSIKNDFMMNIALDKKNNKKNINNNIILTPGDPTDDHLTLLLQSKFNAIGNEKVLFTSLLIENKRSKNLKFIFVGEGSEVLPEKNVDWIEGICYHTKPWWCRNDLTTMDLPKMGNFERPFYDLSFDNILNNDFLNFSDRNIMENGEAKIIRPKFKPTIIKNDDKN